MAGKPEYKLKTGSHSGPGPAEGPGADRDGRKSKKETEQQQTPVYKTEDMLKQEARERAAEQARLEALAKPRSERQKKLENFWFHYRGHTIAAVFGAILLIFFLRDIVFRERPDLTLVVATCETYVSQDEADALELALEGVADDYNGDGSVSVMLDVIYVSPAAMPSAFADTDEEAVGGGAEVGSAVPADGAQEAVDMSAFGMAGSDPEMDQASMMKLMAVTSAWTDPMFLIDDRLYEYFAVMSSPTEYDDAGSIRFSDGRADPTVTYDAIIGNYTIFEPIDGVDAAEGKLRDRLSVADTAIAAAPGCERLSELTFALRPAGNEKEKTVAYQMYCAELLRKLAGAAA